MTTVLAIGDQHFQESNMVEVEMFINKIEALAKSKQPDIIVCLGDLLHTHERLYSDALNKACEFVDRMRSITKTYVLVGNHDMCFGKDTLFLSSDGENVIKVQDIKVGNMLLGIDKTPRKVLRITSGINQMYKVIQKYAISYIVSKNHYLSLMLSDMYSKSNEIIDISVESYLNSPIKNKLCGFKVSNGLIIKTPIIIHKIPTDNYYGFSVDKDRRILLEDGTVVHNCNNQQFLTDNHWLNCLKKWKNVVIVDRPVTETIDDELFVFCPYVFPGRFTEALNTLDIDWKNASGIFAHQEFAGCKMGAIVSVEGDKWPVDNPYVISGHIHSKQIIQENIYYTGSAMQHAFGESEKKYCCISYICRWRV